MSSLSRDEQFEPRPAMWCELLSEALSQAVPAAPDVSASKHFPLRTLGLRPLGPLPLCFLSFGLSGKCGNSRGGREVQGSRSATRGRHPPSAGPPGSTRSAFSQAEPVPSWREHLPWDTWDSSHKHACRVAGRWDGCCVMGGPARVRPDPTGVQQVPRPAHCPASGFSADTSGVGVALRRGSRAPSHGAPLCLKKVTPPHAPRPACPPTAEMSSLGPQTIGPRCRQVCGQTHPHPSPPTRVTPFSWRRESPACSRRAQQAGRASPLCRGGRGWERAHSSPVGGRPVPTRDGMCSFPGSSA